MMASRSTAGQGGGGGGGGAARVGRAEYAPDIHAPVPLEILVLGRDDGVAQHGGKVVVLVDDPALQRKLADHAVLVVVQLGDGAGPVFFQLCDLGKIGGIHQQHSGNRSPGGDGQNQKKEYEVADVD